MSEIRRAIVKSYDAVAHKAAVQIAGSLAVWLDDVRVATNIPPADVVTGRQCTVLFLDPSNQDDAVIIAIQGALPSVGEILIATSTADLTLTTSYQSITGDGDSSKVRLLLPTPGDWLIEATCDLKQSGGTNPGGMEGALFLNDSGTAEPGTATFNPDAVQERATVPQQWKVTTTAEDVPIELKAKMELSGGNGLLRATNTRLTATGVKRSTGGGGGVTVHGDLTGRDQEDHSAYGPLSQANAWAALQTFSAGLQLATSQQIKDSGGTGRIALATSSPEITLTGDVKMSAGLTLRGQTLLNNVDMYTSNPAGGVGVIVDRGDMGSGAPIDANFIGLSGRAASINGGSVTGRIIGLEFYALSVRNTSPASEVTGITLLAGAAFSANVRATLQRGIHLKTTAIFGGTLGVDCRGVEIADPSAGQAGVTTAYALKIDPIAGATNRYGIHMGAIAGGTIARLLELGTGPELRLLGRGEWTPTANETPLYLAEGVTPTLRQIKWKDGAAIGAGDRVMVLV